MQSSQTSNATRLSVEQCFIAIDVLNRDTMKYPPTVADPIVTLMKIAQAWIEADSGSSGRAPLVVASRDLVYLDRSGNETIIYSRSNGTYSLGRANDTDRNWATL